MVHLSYVTKGQSVDLLILYDAVNFVMFFRLALLVIFPTRREKFQPWTK